MCNHALRDRHVLKYAAEIIDGLEVPEPFPEFTPHAYPKGPSPIVVAEPERPTLQLLRWGIGYTVKGKPTLVTNARDDQLAKISLWKESAARRRCLIPVVGYFEPGPGPVGARGEVLFRIKDQPVFFIAGVWDADPDGTRAYAMVTTTPNAYTAPFQDRQPVVLSVPNARRWLGAQPLVPDELIALTRPPPSEVMTHEIIPAAPKPPRATPDDGQGELF